MMISDPFDISLWQKVTLPCTSGSGWNELADSYYLEYRFFYLDNLIGCPREEISDT